MRHVILVARLLLGLTFFVFGLNGFLSFIPMPPPEGAAGVFMGGLAASGYFFPLLKVTETVAGALLLAGRWVPLALTLLAPVVVNIVGFHLAVAPGGLGMALFLLALGVFLAWAHRDSFRGVLEAKAVPTSGRPKSARSEQAQTSSVPATQQ